MFVSNLGDSRAILISEDVEGGNDGEDVSWVVTALSSDHTLYRQDERERVKKFGARILTNSQILGEAPLHEDWDDLTLGDEIDETGDPPRMWSPFGPFPGAAYSRSFGAITSR